MALLFAADATTNGESSDMKTALGYGIWDDLR